MGILKKPLITEKSQKLQDSSKKYTFIVDKKANKVAIKRAIEEMYGVNVAEVNTNTMPSKPKSKYTKSNIISGRRGSYKKAVISLSAGEEIDFYTDL
ncbi:MAG TPA: 50S ribosomal protein L23 [Chitinophagales bacterium]|nr:50S ribosomal protein L23 [Chitinophagales bacterium]HMU98100.1 50S ribosomal protein L23 [Chitinophagales bacterium]HMY43128.1 50S ribosomal protein L23 [Chitinophagales bacterium]HMZ69280.1 50S ribosomal protein L23 [Chitinophagales bacterium]HNB39114.1 50S ribosomal protein L23 [Chitinophagales bacterium]